MFRKKVEDLRFSDVVAFLQQSRQKGYKEGVSLDYKRDMIAADKIARLASAFANTKGGCIVFGAGEQDGFPLPPFAGGNIGGNPVQKVTVACHRAVSPSLKVFVSRPLRNPTGPSKGFLVVAVPQSGRTPHRIGDRVYVKVEDQKEPLPPTSAVYEELRDGRRAPRARADEIRKEAATAWRAISEKLISPRTGQPRDQTVASAMHVSVDVCAAYPDGQELASPQEIISRLDRYRILVRTPGLGEFLVPAADRPDLETFGRGARCAWQADGSRVVHCAAMHSHGAYYSYSLVPCKQGTIHARGEDQMQIWYVTAESVSCLFRAQLRSALRWFRSFGHYSALSARWSVYSSGEELHIIHPRHTAGERVWAGNTFGPERPRVQGELQMSWADAAGCRLIEERVIQEFVSSFNVRESRIIQVFAERSAQMIRPFRL